MLFVAQIYEFLTCHLFSSLVTDIITGYIDMAYMFKYVL